ncbi:polyphosphate kinase 1 [Blastopirellula sp. JC732]|uniref:Polyphosphate kinase n=1 Tax=Blastopirellula sediminis TaxID=2894196 RepID=A0A9X1MMX6_9BACT|nr:polyphosphate kinase 1 [Blastopirellula sediminis]MCC9607186.1 polyphosphate kinase 1 [Blastopirellula sediminis]MCC9629521.1 polyphosphate kinase 1 [Blastopirellula sediminis]
MLDRPEVPVADEPKTWRDAWFDRDLSWLEFNRRVLQQALDDRTPLLERVKFLAIFTSNLDEFFMKRLALLRTRKRAELSHSIGAPATELHLQALRQAVAEMYAQQGEAYDNAILPQLAENGIHLLQWEDLTDAQRTRAHEFFTRNVYPALTPLALDPGHPFPYMSNLSISLGFVLRVPDSEENLFARVKVPNILPQWIALEDEDKSKWFYLGLKDLIHHNAGTLFPGMNIVDSTSFRITRNAEVELDDDDDTESLRTVVAEELRQRKFQPVVRLEIESNPNPWVRGLLMRQFELTEEDVYELPSELDYSGLMPIANLDLKALRDEPWNPVIPNALLDDEADIFSVIKAGDLMVHHPYDSFDATVENFIRRAARDPKVVAIKMTVYRVGDDTPFVRSLIQAAESGKQVACLIELKARFDEERNLHWAKELEKIGAHVVYGVLGLKTHTKIALVVRKEADGLRCYAHIGTGNYHVKTARIYTDIGLFTCDPVICNDVVNLFHMLTGRSRSPSFDKLLVAPINMREKFLQMVQREIDNHQQGLPALIVAKFNAMEDPELCRAIVEASQAGVQVELIVRGFACLRPGVEGVTDNVRLRSIVGRFLEHSRIYYFANGAETPLDGEFYIGSADWMSRNLTKRVEAIVPIEARPLKERLWEILDICLKDRRQAWMMQPDGSYQMLMPSEDDPEVARLGTHQALMALTLHRAKDRLA